MEKVTPGGGAPGPGQGKKKKKRKKKKEQTNKKKKKKKKKKRKRKKKKKKQKEGKKRKKICTLKRNVTEKSIPTRNSLEAKKRRRGNSTQLPQKVLRLNAKS